MKKLIIFTAFLGWSLHSQAAPFCMTTHMKEALSLNKARASYYEHLSGGTSKAVSAALIQYEKSKMNDAWLADIWATPFQLRGINIVCEDIVSMAKAPALGSVKIPAFDLREYQAPNVSEIQRKLGLLLEQNKFQEIVSLSTEELGRLEEQPQTNCLLRHFLESIRRSAGLAMPLHTIAKKKMFFSTLPLSKKMLSTQISDLRQIHEIDLKAVAVQSLGVPMICQDVPFVPAYSSMESLI